MDEQSVPYRRMPMRYLAVWIGIHLFLLSFNWIQQYGWPPANMVEFLTMVGIGSLVGGWLWGWVLWRTWLYKKFPENRP